MPQLSHTHPPSRVAGTGLSLPALSSSYLHFFIKSRCVRRRAIRSSLVLACINGPPGIYSPPKVEFILCTLPQVKEQITKYLPRIKCCLLGTHEDPPSDEQVAEVVHAIVHENTPPLLELLVTTLPFLRFEVSRLFCIAFHNDAGEEMSAFVAFALT
jgi:hypothetical protein